METELISAICIKEYHHSDLVNYKFEVGKKYKCEIETFEKFETDFGKSLYIENRKWPQMRIWYKNSWQYTFKGRIVNNPYENYLRLSIQDFNIYFMEVGEYRNLLIDNL